MSVLPRLRAVGSPQLTIFADAACAASSFQVQAGLLTKLGTRYRVVPVDLGQARRFHPKAFFLAGSEAVSLAVGSGNTTYGGWSGNKEIWTDFALPGDGGGQIASFRAYLENILSYVPDPAAIRAEVLGPFLEVENGWIAALTEPSGLAWTPSAMPMLEQIVGQIGNPISTIDVLSPYFDPDGEALSRLANLSLGNVRVMLQPRRAGLSQDIVAGLPTKVGLHGIEPVTEDSRHKFIHAKTYVFETAAGTFLAAGSANCSRAALMANASWGNAELMALSQLTQPEVEDFWSGFAVTDVPPDLPATYPSEEWSIETSELRILGARKDGSTLTVYFKAEVGFAQLAIQTQADLLVQAQEHTDNRAIFDLVEYVSSVTLIGVTRDGLRVASLPCWVDDERSLRMAPTERMLRDRLEEAAAKGSLLGREFLQIVELFDLHVQRDTAHGGAGSKESRDDASPSYFSEADIYADSFGKPATSFHPSLSGGFSDIDEYALIYSFFHTPGEQPEMRRTARIGKGNEENEGDDNDPENVPKAPIEDKEREAQKARFAKLLAKIEASIRRPEYVRQRKADRLSADIAFLAILMAKARSDSLIDEQPYRIQSLQFWRVLFFGSNGFNGLVPSFLAETDDATRSAFVAKMRSPRLSAAMTLWCTLDWAGVQTEAKRFRFSTALLAGRLRWLAEGGDQAPVVTELQRLADKLFPASRREDLLAAWIQWVRDGYAFETLRGALSTIDQAVLAARCTRSILKAGEFVWQTKYGLCVLSQDTPRPSKAKATLMSSDGSNKAIVQANFVAPLIDILQSDIGVSEPVKRNVFDLFAGIRTDLH